MVPYAYDLRLKIQDLKKIQNLRKAGLTIRGTNGMYMLSWFLWKFLVSHNCVHAFSVVLHHPC